MICECDRRYEQAASDLARRCLAKFDDTEASPDLRTFSMSVMVSQINSGNVAMHAHAPDICKRLKDLTVLMQPATTIAAKDYHCEIINALCVIFDSLPEEIVCVGWMRPAVRYLVELVSCRDTEVATSACGFWARRVSCIPGMVAAAFRRSWTKLITALMDQMIIRDNAESSAFASLREQAVAAFESVSEVCPPELFCATLRPLMERRIESDLWPEKESAIQALRASTNAGQ